MTKEEYDAMRIRNVNSAEPKGYIHAVKCRVCESKNSYKVKEVNRAAIKEAVLGAVGFGMLAGLIGWFITLM